MSVKDFIGKYWNRNCVLFCHKRDLKTKTFKKNFSPKTQVWFTFSAALLDAGFKSVGPDCLKYLTSSVKSQKTWSKSCGFVFSQAYERLICCLIFLKQGQGSIFLWVLVPEILCYQSHERFESLDKSLPGEDQPNISCKAIIHKICCEWLLNPLVPNASFLTRFLSHPMFLGGIGNECVKTACCNMDLQTTTAMRFSLGKHLSEGVNRQTLFCQKRIRVWKVESSLAIKNKA